MTYLASRVDKLREQGVISFNRSGSEKFMQYQGTIEDVVSRLKSSFGKKPAQRNLEFFLFANRLLIGIIDYGIRTNENLLELKHEVEEFCQDIYRGNLSSAYFRLENLDFPKEMLDSPVVENKDNISWKAFDPRLIKRLVKKINPPNVSKLYLPDYIVLDGHDAYRPGLMLASAFDLSSICAIRNAQDSKRDSVPRLLNAEEGYLRTNFFNKDLLLLGEDSSTGNALNSLYQKIIEVSRPRNIFTAAPIFIPGDNPLIGLDYYGEESVVYGYSYMASLSYLL
jgi:hypothetical protein